MEASHHIALESDIAALSNELIEKTTLVDQLEKVQGYLLLDLEDSEQTVRRLLEARDEIEKKHDKETKELKETIRIQKEEIEELQKKYKEMEGCSSSQKLEIASLRNHLTRATFQYSKLHKRLAETMGPEVKPEKKEQKDQSTEYFVPLTDAPSSSSDKIAEFNETRISDQSDDKKEKENLEEMKERLDELQLNQARLRLKIEENEAICDKKMKE